MALPHHYLSFRSLQARSLLPQSSTQGLGFDNRALIQCPQCPGDGLADAKNRGQNLTLKPGIFPPPFIFRGYPSPFSKDLTVVQKLLNRQVSADKVLSIFWDETSGMIQLMCHLQNIFQLGYIAEIRLLFEIFKKPEKKRSAP
jgi:hypothetical protein